jgi:hypothetical protein
VNPERIKAYLIGLGAVVASAWPALAQSRDSFPLSTFPMFSHPRGQPWLDVVVGLDERGHSQALEPRLVANAETLQAAAAISRAVRSGPAATKRLCREVAKNVAAEPELSSVIWVEVRSEKYDPIEYFTEGPEPLESRKRGRCRVPR